VSQVECTRLWENVLTIKEQSAMSHTTFRYKPDHSYSKYPQRSVLRDVAKSAPILLTPREMWQQYGHVENSWNQQVIHIHTSDKKAFNKKTKHTLKNRINIKYSAYSLENVCGLIYFMFFILHLHMHVHSHQNLQLLIVFL
jgi:hypothetical protein